ncbi:glycosyltransferase family 4 protein [Embleya sp. NPDC059237]|uniref:glycosyltransferase family 4 protein n=1 Tax=Embleya sp. NPDC059237 TaxID=3346784 RepID=UPI00369EDE5F
MEEKAGVLAAHPRPVPETPRRSALPALPWDEVPTWLAEASAIIVPSSRETFGLVAAEAMSVGTPFVSHRTGNLPDLLAGVPGADRLLVEPALGSPGLVAAVHELLANPVTYAAVTWAVYYAASDYRPIRVAETFLKAVS